MPVRPPVHRPPGWKPAEPWAHAPGKASASSRGYGTDWRRLRAEVLADEPWCREHMKSGELVKATHVDHIRPKAEGGTDNRLNLQPLCYACHMSKSGREGGSSKRY